MRVAELTAAEKVVWDAFPHGGLADFTVGDPARDDPAGGAAWGPERTVRASIISALLLGSTKSASGSVSALRITGARITGELDLRHAEFRHRVSLAMCSFEDDVVMYSVRASRVGFRGSHLRDLTLARAVLDGDLRLEHCRVAGRLRVDGADIRGGLILDGAELANPHGVALNADRVRIGDDLQMRHGFCARGTVRLRNARIGSDVTMTDARLSAPGGDALEAARIQVGGDFLADGLESEGRVALAGAQIAGLLRLAGAKLHNPGDTALSLYQTRIGANLQCYEAFQSVGRIRMVGIHIGGHAQFDDADLRASDSGGGSGSTRGAGIDAIDAQYADITGMVSFRAATVLGPVRFHGAHVGNALDFQGAALTAGDASTVAYLEHLRAAELNLCFRQAPDGPIALSHAQIGILTDERSTWPPALYLDGFTCDRFTAPGTVADRLAWLARDAAGYQPQPFEHLAAAYRRLGLDGEARRVLLAKQRARRRTLPAIARAWGVVQDAAVGYGYRPERAVGWLAALLAVGTAVFGLHHPAAAGPPPAPSFNPLIYTLDLLLPIINFGQGKAFIAQGGYQMLAYLLTAAGWILATTIAAGVGRAVNRN
jgi:hypothetical protein